MGALNKSNNKGFTFIEVLISIAVIGVLASLLTVSLLGAREKSRISRAKADLNQLQNAVRALETDTNVDPNKTPLIPCSDGSMTEIYLHECKAGIQCNDGFQRWRGPYMDVVPLDPWGTNYYFDPTYQCGAGTSGCNGIGDGANTSRVIQSFGPNKVQEMNGGDDIVLVLCRS